MRRLAFLLPLLLVVGLIFILDRPQQISEKNLPPMGRVLNPFSGVWQNAGDAGIQSREIQNLPGLRDEVEVVFDSRMVPHIFARNDEDAVLVQGYLHAKDRLFQMDFHSRAAAGRMSEILGPVALEYDKRQRRMGFTTAARTAANSWLESPEARSLLEAYVNGINHFIENLEYRDYPIEFKILNYEPESWSVYKSALFAKLMAYDLSGYTEEVEATNSLRMLGRQDFDYLFPHFDTSQTPVIPEEKNWNFVPATADSLEPTSPHTFFGLLPHRPDRANGSNNWVISGKRTASGYPILANDPHLSLKLPSLWYEIQLQTPNMNAYGASLPGLPAIIIGFNENIAWGETNVGQDVLDWYTVKWTDEKKNIYWLDGEKRRADKLVEVIKVKDAPAVFDTVKYTYWGPVVYTASDHPYRDLALSWMPHEAPPSNEMLSFIGLCRATSHDDFYEALKNYYSPAQNFIFASRSGDIALRVQGRFPIKSKEQGRFVSEGDATEAGWKGYIPYEHLPSIKNPKQGFLSSANQRSTDLDYPYYYNGNFMFYRGRYLNRRLAGMENASIDDVKALQKDVYSLFAEEATPLLLQYTDTSLLSRQEKELLQTLKEWDYRYKPELMAPVLLEEWYDAFYQAAWDEFFFHADSSYLLYPEDWRTLELLRTAPENKFFDIAGTKEVEKAKDLVTASFKSTVASLQMLMDASAQSPEQQLREYNWGQHKSTDILHLLRLESFSALDLPVGGYGHCLNAIKEKHGPSWRMIVELGPEVKAFGIYPGGQSGHPGSPYYDNAVEPWSNGEYFPLWLMKDPNDPQAEVLFRQRFN